LLNSALTLTPPGPADTPPFTLEDVDWRDMIRKKKAGVDRETEIDRERTKPEARTREVSQNQIQERWWSAVKGASQVQIYRGPLDATAG
jgi:hypothetical protein